MVQSVGKQVRDPVFQEFCDASSKDVFS